MATCWASYSRRGDCVFVTDDALSRLVELNANDGSISSTTILSNQGQGYLDIWAAGDFVYALYPGNGTTEASITVFETTKGKQVQRALLGNEGAGKNAMGMAFIEL